MFTIRRDQMDAFESQAFDAYAARVQAFVTRSFPDRCAEMGEPTVRDAVRHAIRRAFDHGLADEDDAARYTVIAFALHRDFDRDPTFPWAAEILRRRDSPGWLRCERLYQHTTEHLRRATPPGGV